MLARKGKKYKQRKGVEAGARLILNRVDISQRPAIVDDNSEIGHWEGDTVYGQDVNLVTMVERVSKLLVTCKVRSKSKKAVTRGINRMMKPFKELCKTITFDNGGEFTGHTKIANLRVGNLRMMSKTRCIVTGEVDVSKLKPCYMPLKYVKERSSCIIHLSCNIY